MKPRMYYFDPWDRAGHYRFNEHGGSVYFPEREKLPWGDDADGGLQPHRDGCKKMAYCGCGSGPEGIALIHHKDGWTALSFWDRSVDTRGACNSTYIAEGDFTFDQMVTMAKAHNSCGRICRRPEAARCCSAGNRCSLCLFARRLETRGRTSVQLPPHTAMSDCVTALARE